MRNGSGYTWKARGWWHKSGNVHCKIARDDRCWKLQVKLADEKCWNKNDQKHLRVYSAWYLFSWPYNWILSWQKMRNSQHVACCHFSGLASSSVSSIAMLLPLLPLLSSDIDSNLWSQLRPAYSSCVAYCWWKKSQTTTLGCMKPCNLWDNTISTGAGFFQQAYLNCLTMIKSSCLPWDESSTHDIFVRRSEQ